MRERMKCGMAVVCMLVMGLVMLGLGVALEGCGCGRSVEHVALDERSTCERDSVTKMAYGAESELSATHAMAESSERQLVRVETWDGVPADSARVRVAVSDIVSLPEGAGWSERQGRAEVTARRLGDWLEISGNCDSVWRRCEMLEWSAQSWRAKADSLVQRTVMLEAMLEDVLHSEEMARALSEKTKEAGGGVRRWVCGLAVSAVCGACAGWWLTKKRN